jgi:hypothetical protein
MYCVALDPGGTTGVCLIEDKSKQWEIKVDEFGPKPHHHMLWHHLTVWKPEVLICESFEGNMANEAVRFQSLEYIGVVKAYVQARFTICELVWQSGSTCKQFWDDKRLRQYNMYWRGLKHARDATRHYLYYQTFTRKDDSLLRRSRG